MADVPVVFALSILLLVVFGFWENHVERQTSTPPIVKLDLFTRHKWRISAVLLIAFLDWCGICVSVTWSSCTSRLISGLGLSH
jgi:hypothetical protein